MCFDLDSAPPILTQPRTPATGAALRLRSADGAGFSAYFARPQQASGLGVVVLPDNRGLFPFYEQLALRLAEQGHCALAIDYYGRTAGTVPRDESFSSNARTSRMMSKRRRGFCAPAQAASASERQPWDSVSGAGRRSLPPRLALGLTA
jgi:dienelactone hydrolase